MLNVVKFIQEHDDWEQLLTSAPYHVRIKKGIVCKGNDNFIVTVSNEVPFPKNNTNNLVLLNYSQGLSEVCEITNECRSLVLDVTDPKNCKVVRYGFYRFFNLGDPNGAKLGNNISTTEKVDGSLILLYNYKGYWHFGTRSTFDMRTDNVEASNVERLRYCASQVNNYIYNKSIWNIHDLNPNCTYCFEFVSPDFQIVVPYKEVNMYFLMCRDNVSEQEVETGINFIRPKTYDFKTIKDIENYVSQFKGNEFEGIVVKDENNNRLKVKNLNWLELHYLWHNGQFSDRYILELYFQNDYDELLTYFPNLRDRFDNIISTYNKIKKVAELFDKLPIDTILTKKQFYDIVNRTVKEAGYQKLVLKAYDHYAYEWFCKLDSHWYSHYFLKED